jgi:hypothetical protein
MACIQGLHRGDESHMGPVPAIDGSENAHFAIRHEEREIFIKKTFV